jgi:hypothetical protein
LRGFTFPPGAYARYNAKTSLLTVKHNEVQLDIVQAVADVLREGKDPAQDDTPPAPEPEPEPEKDAPEANPPN